MTSWDNATVGSGAVKNEVEYEYGKWGVVETIWQDPDGAVVKTGGSPTQQVTYAYQFPSSGESSSLKKLLVPRMVSGWFRSARANRSRCREYR